MQLNIECVMILMKTISQLEMQFLKPLYILLILYDIRT